MNDDIIYAGISHKDIIYNGWSHKAVYLGNKIIWEKDGSGRGIELRFQLPSGESNINNIIYFYEISPSNYYNDKHKYISFDMFCNMFENDNTTAIIPYGNYYVNRVGIADRLWDLAYRIGANNIIENLFYGKNVQNITHIFYGAQKYKKLPMPHNNIIDMSCAYDNCRNLTGSPVCGPNVINMFSTYYNCMLLTGSPVCGNSVINMSYAYRNCMHLTGSPVCGNSVIDMSCAYRDCWNLTGSPVCGNNVVNMAYAYYNCDKLKGSIMYIQGEKRTIDVTSAFFGVSNVTIYCQSNITLVGIPKANIIYF